MTQEYRPATVGLLQKPIDAKEASMLFTTATSPRRVVNGLESLCYGGHVPLWSRASDFHGHRISIADGDRLPRPRMQMGS